MQNIFGAIFWEAPSFERSFRQNGAPTEVSTRKNRFSTKGSMVNKTHIFPETIPQIFHKTMDKKLFESKIDSTNQLQKEQQCRNECPKFYLFGIWKKAMDRQNVIVCFFFEWSFGVPIVSTFGKSRSRVWETTLPWNSLVLEWCSGSFYCHAEKGKCFGGLKCFQTWININQKRVKTFETELP